MADWSDCPKCEKHTVIHELNVGRAKCNVCIQCGWCTVHNRFWPSVHNKKERNT